MEADLRQRRTTEICIFFLLLHFDGEWEVAEMQGRMLTDKTNRPQHKIWIIKNNTQNLNQPLQQKNILNTVNPQKCPYYISIIIIIRNWWFPSTIRSTCMCVGLFIWIYFSVWFTATGKQHRQIPTAIILPLLPESRRWISKQTDAATNERKNFFFLFKKLALEAAAAADVNYNQLFCFLLVVHIFERESNITLVL